MRNWTRLVSADTVIGAHQLFHTVPSDDAIALETIQDVTEIVEANKAEKNLFDERTPWKGDLHKVASIPAIVVTQLRKDGILYDQERLKAWLNHPDNAVFRTRPGKV